MRIEKITDGKKRYLDLLLLADEQESMIDRYLEDGDMFALFDGDGDAKTVCVVVAVDEDTCELKNIATREQDQGKGYATAMMEFVCELYAKDFGAMLVGTGDVPPIVAFYERCGFAKSHRVKNFFVDNYDHPMFDSGVRLVDMLYLKKDLRSPAAGSLP